MRVEWGFGGGGGGGGEGVGGRRLRVANGRVRWLCRMGAGRGEGEACLRVGMWRSGLCGIVGGEGGCRGEGRRRRRRRPRGCTFFWYKSWGLEAGRREMNEGCGLLGLVPR